MKLKPFMIVSILCIITFTTTTTHAKRITPQLVRSVIKDGIEYSAPLNPDRIGFVNATWLKTKRVIWSRQIYTIKYEHLLGLEQDVQWLFITKLAFSGNKLIITNELGYKYNLDLDSLEVKVVKGKCVIDNTNRKVPSEP